MFMRLVSPSYHHMNLQNLLIILVHFLVAHHRSAVQFFLLPSEILTDLMRTKPNDIFAPSRHPRRPEPVVKKLFPASKALLLDGIVVLILEVSQSWPTAVAHGDSEFSPVYTLLVTCHLSTPRFFPTHKFYPAAMHSPPCSLQQTMDDTAVTAISAAPLDFTHSNISTVWFKAAAARTMLFSCWCRGPLRPTTENSTGQPLNNVSSFHQTLF